MASLRLWTVVIAAAVFTHHPCSGQSPVPGENPDISAFSAFRPVQSSSVCGEQGQEDYCVYTPDSAASLLPNCMRLQCNNTCPFSSSSPEPLDLAALSSSFGSGISATQGRPGADSSALRFQNSSISILAASVPAFSSNGFSFAAWINQDDGNEGALISKVSGVDGTDINYALSVSSSSLTLMYRPTTGGSAVRTFTLSGLDLSPDYWHHIALTVFAEDAAFYVNGSLAGVASLDGSIMDDALRDIKLGQIASTDSSYNGLMQDIYYYNQALTEREVIEVVTGSLPFLHLSTECHCPPSHPTVNDQNQASCTQHPGLTTPRGSVGRTNPLSHPAGYLNDLSRSVEWISSPGVREVNITLNLTNSLYEVFLVTIHFSTPRPKAAVLQTSRDGGLTYRPVQYFADDCMLYFGLPDNAPILAADDVNCDTSISSQLPTFNGVLRFRFRNQAVRNFDLDTSPEFRDFLTASHIRLQLLDYFTDSTSQEHRYYAIQEVAVAARCACNGHASRCGSEIDAVCECLHNTQGPTCDQCLPSHNDKPWRYGTTANGFPCKPCRCNGHATTCTYDPAVDLFPDSYEVGGGGVCVDCQNNTAGVNCETCRFGYFRPTERLPSDPNPCEECMCHPGGITDGGDCVKDQGSGGQIIGQCSCKENVIGLRCDVCRPGFTNLSASNPLGCNPCGCNTAGTFGGTDTCDGDTGQCLCKANVEGLKCDRCRAGTTSLNETNPLGCEGCSCDPTGALDTLCDAVTGRCVCRPGVTGSRCDQCLGGFTGFSASGCSECACHPVGSVDSSCDPVSGDCSCRLNVVGGACDACAPGFYNISAGCVPCDCETAGTVNGSATCDSETGQCACKANVRGRTCNSCAPGFTALQASNSDGCSACDCSSPNADQSGEICDPVTSQCTCSPSSTGLRCETCLDNFYMSESGCQPCGCDLDGSTSSICDQTSGNCSCRSEGITGRTCATCLSGFFQFPSCSSCGCDEAGAVEGSLCNQTTGTCSCKLYVTGASCDQCLEGFLNLEASNPFGCSATPDELAPPTLVPSASSIELTWVPPEAPNGFIQGYNVFRDNTSIATVTGLTYTSTGLLPDTAYSFFLEAFNSAGVTRSAVVTGRTIEGVPSGLAPPMLTPISADSIRAMWIPPTTPNGVIVRYELVRMTSELNVTVFTDLALTATASGLLPFTEYSFLVRACTITGCGMSESAQARTLEAPPTSQMRPNVSTLTSSSLLVEWVEPEEPNGIVTLYEVRQRSAPFQGDGMFLGNISSLAFTVSDLQPFTTYEFSVVAYTGGGGAQSEWSAGITAESVPADVQPPILVPLTSSELQLNWSAPLTPNGVIVLYQVFQLDEEGGETMVASSPSPGSSVVGGLQPFTEYSFTLMACTAEGCNRSQPISGFTQEGIPSGQPPPQVNATTATSVSLTWDQPSEPNGLISSYSVLRRRPSLHPSPLLRDVGVAFDGNALRQFSPEDNALGGISNTITFSFRTFSTRGVILYYINAAGSDYIGIELRNGIPWFFFDAGSGPAAIQPDLMGQDVTFNNGEWHSVMATQTSRTGSVTVDGTYTGTGESTGSSQVISSRQVLYVGGIPQGVPRSSTLGLGDPAATLSSGSYAGCLYGMTLNGEVVDFESGTNLLVGSLIAVPTDIPGCPVQIEPGLSFLGGGFLSYPPDTLHTSSFSWGFNLRTTHSQGLVFFAHTANQSSVAVELSDSLVYLVLSEGSSSQRLAIGSNSTCDGEWHTLLLDQSLDEVFLSVDGVGRSLFLQSTDAVFSSPVYFGGIPMNSQAYGIAWSVGIDVSAPLSGCVRPRTDQLVVGGVTTLAELEPSAWYLVRFDGCPAATDDSACVEPWVTASAGANMEFNDVGLQPWTEYLYRVRAENSAGSTGSRWVAAITAEDVPSGLGTVSLVSQTSSSLTVSWAAPTASNGLITRYDVTFVPVRTVGLEEVSGDTVTASLSVTMPETVLLATANGLQPATTYAASLTGYTVGGAGTGSPLELTTDESVPTDVQPPTIVGVGSRELTVTWSLPDVPNGLITLYSLYVDGDLAFSGNTNITILSGLSPFTEYSLLLEACTSVGCTNSSTPTIGQTLPDAPSGLAPPTLTVLSPSSIQARWGPPANPNGVITRLELRSLLGVESGFQVVFVDVNMDFETTLTGLLPDTLYTFQLVAFNAGGSVSSPSAQALTLEDIPDDISAPSVERAGPTHLEVSWSPPAIPNGDIILYNLTLDGSVVFSTDQDLAYNITDLRPFTAYSLAVIACTIRGCGSSNTSSAMTLEDVPKGYVPPTVLSISPTSITLLVHRVVSENGIATYSLSIAESAGELEEEGEGRVILSSTDPSQVIASGLLPFTNYSLLLEVTNSAGSLLGAPFEVQTLPTLAEGFPAPSLSLLDATTILVEWEEPLRPNGLLLSYQVTRTLVGGGSPVTSSHGLSTSAILSDLTPFTLYLVSVTVRNTEGSTVSPQANITTGETAPSGFDQIVLLERGSRHVRISWDPPAMSNGLLVNYTVSVGGEDMAATPPNVLDYNVTELLPFTAYNFSVMACTSAGCVESSTLTVTTREDIPEGIAAPFVSATSSQQPVLVVWAPPLAPNGVVLAYRVERRDGGSNDSSLVVVAMLPGSEAALVTGDQTTDPFTLYSYRVVAINSAGEVASEFTPFLTPEAAPVDVSPPVLEALSSSVVQVTFEPPLDPRGNVTMYTITRTPARIFTFAPSSLPELTDKGTYVFNDTGLRPFTNYTYILRICTGGGCTDSEPSTELTLEGTPTGMATPTTAVVSSSEIRVEWEEPSMPNGIVQSYLLFRQAHGFQSPSGPTNSCCEAHVQGGDDMPATCTQVAATGGNMYLDGGLRPFSFYSYCLVATNNAASAHSPTSPPTQTSPAPELLASPTLNATTLNSTAVFLEWDMLELSELLGPLEGYTVYVRVGGAPGLGEAVFEGRDQSFTATGLLASTQYVFVVEVSNGVGSALSNNATATTEEGIPVDLPAPEVEAVRSDALSVTIFEPLQPNGQIILYNVILDSQLVRNVSIPEVLLLEDLQPFTLYTVRIEACTQFGCARSPLTAATTLESIPVGLASPFVVVTGPNTVEISWSPPNQPNGNITEYRILVRERPSEPATVFPAGLGLSLVVSSLSPFTSYHIQVTAENSAGNTTSIPTTVTTLPAPPTSFAPPLVTVLSAGEIAVSWSEPGELNGLLLGYQVYRDGEPLLPGLTLSLTFLDQDLTPATEYEYFVQVCGSGGCRNTTSVANTTLEALPEGVSDLEVSVVSACFLVLTWAEPELPNGEVTEYVVTQTGSSSAAEEEEEEEEESAEVVFRGLGLNTTVTDLAPFTDYSFILMVCNSVGCSAGNTTSARTSEADPEGLDVPVLRNLTSTSVAISWTAPARPNGLVSAYVLRRSDASSPNETTVLFQGLNTSFNDLELVADTLYLYTVEAINGGGSVISSPSFFRTVPDLAEGIDPPTVEVRGATEVFVTWSAPDAPNGEISMYRLYRDEDVVFAGLGFSFLVTGLAPFTTYSFFVEVCNQAGCASSISVSAQTRQAPVGGVSPPTLIVLGPTAVRVSWTTPTQPNGEITEYQIRRRLLNDFFTESIQHVGPITVLSFVNSGLTPFTVYEYRLRVRNGNGTVFSDWVSVQTSEDVPTGLPLPMVAEDDIAARNVTASWTPPTSPNGVLLRYVLEYRVAVDPVTFGPGEIITAEEVPANVTVATAMGLSPVTQYEFRVVAINSAGSGQGPFTIVITREDLPEGLRPIIVEQRTSSTLSLSWNPPLTPHGIVREYRILLDGETVYRDLPLTHTVTRLQPFTSYSIQLGVCTSVGCSFGSVQSATTLEVAPVGQGNPTLLVLTSGSVQVTWEAPVQPNGIITRYDILRQVGSDASTLAVVFSTPDVTNRSFVDMDVDPARTYSYVIRTANSAGSVDGGNSSVTTPEAAPEGLAPPVLTPLNATTVQVSWLPPVQPNGVLIAYRVFRSGGGATDVTAYSNIDTSIRAFTDFGLQPFTGYTYVLQACTAAACALSPVAVATTNEAAPADLSPPVLMALSESSIAIQWAEPATPNGIITMYNIAIAPAQISLALQEPQELARNISNLLPFTTYTVQLEACNSVGCTSGSATVTTQESTPGFTAPPQPSVINATSLNVSWAEPNPTNGMIVSYELRRNGTLVFSGNALTFVDVELAPNEYYAYTLQAYTAVGAGTESAQSAVIRTPPDTPEGVAPPTLRATDSTSILASWTAPSTPNGVIQRYVLLLNGQTVFEMLGFEFEVTGLRPFTNYTFQLMACTTTCRVSEIARAATLEAAPEEQGTPVPREAEDMEGLGVLVTWSPPETPNGIVIRYQLERREGTIDEPLSEFVLLFEGTATSYLDQDPMLRPFRSYVYQVTSHNSVGNVTSDPVPITTSQAAPEAVLPPTVFNFTSDTVTLQATPPATPNGVVSAYRLFQDGVQVQENDSPPDTQFTVTGLEFFTVYRFAVEACTGGGCTRSASITQRTDEALPTGLSPPVGVAVSARVIEVTWRPPAQPNGIILSYSLWYRRACPQPPQPHLPSPECTPGPTLTATAATLSSDTTTYSFEGSGANDPLPYTTYEFLVGTANSEGSVNSSFSEPDTATLQSAPEVVAGVSLSQDFDSGLVRLDWSATFRLNSVLMHYDLQRNGVLLTRNRESSIVLPQEPQNTNLLYVVTVFTAEGSTSANISTQITGQVPGTLDPTGQVPGTFDPVTPAAELTTTASEPTEIPFYEEPAFIVGMVVLGIIILFLLCAVFLCCVRPRSGGDKKGLHLSPSFQVDLDRSQSRKQYSKLNEPSPERVPVTGSWSPGDPITKGEIPDIDDPSEIFELSSPTSKKSSYSPNKVQPARLQSYNQSNRLSDIPIGTSPAKDDFGSFKRYQQTTFEDTKV